MNWGTNIFISIVIFMGIIITMVVISLRQNFHLVTDNYYQEELKYQQQIDKMENYLDLDGSLEIEYSKASGIAKVSFPETTKIIEGKITFFRPSDARYDFHLPVALNDSGIQELNLGDKLPGLWKVKIAWESNGKSYYKEQNIVL